MAFIALRFDADSGDAERWSDALIAAGALSVDLADSSAGTASEASVYGEPGAEHPQLWAKSRLTALFAAGSDIESALGAAACAVREAVPPHAIEEIPDADWVRAARARFEPLCVTGDLWIVPSWREPIDTRALNIRIDPGLAFGSGSHPTTRLCLRWLAERLPRGARVLDYGCGSGILAIAAAKLGAAAVTGVDIDAQAIAASRANAEANGVAVRFCAPDEIGEANPFDVVIANILADPLEMLAPLLAARVNAGGSICLSGILESQAAGLIGVYSRWFNIDAWSEEETWVALAGERSTA
jgi:ribosomal protein L11 methyltransferase